LKSNPLKRKEKKRKEKKRKEKKRKEKRSQDWWEQKTVDTCSRKLDFDFFIARYLNPQSLLKLQYKEKRKL
jgi:hypothetical protein